MNEKPIGYVDGPGGARAVLPGDTVSGLLISSGTPMDVRWMNGRLQQRWWVQTFEGGKCIGGQAEWRDVPVESET